MSDIQLFLDKIQTIEQEKIQSVILSSGKSISLSPLNLKQQKKLISINADELKSGVSFYRVINEILIESSGLDDLLVCDRPLLSLVLRKNSLGEKYGSINLQTIIDKIINYKPQYKKTSTVNFNNLTVEVAIPTLVEENKIIKRLESLITQDLTDSIGLLYSHEIVKYIKSASIDDLNLEFSEMIVADRISILEKLPLALTKQIVTFIEEYKKTEIELLTVESSVVEIDSYLFDIE